ncbi:hypothetical protein [Falsibacillus albus]|uniref:Uncharacterized protein n=1 Tax=Falsibacillus albus TaxID=2478915 RepID=A0A3L7K143_9BACI|nr:hypothetical protein [Falsibacillus albus]RLQ96510.1 hypothetical protein D9X91_05230 [Falsibacillus albus]
MKKFLSTIALMVFCFIFSIHSIHAAPDPSGLEKSKSKAEIHIIGTIQSDRLIEDHSSRQLQDREMNIRIDRIKKLPTNLYWKINDVVPIPYSYIASWGDYSGGRSLQVRKGDLIEVWGNLNNGRVDLVAEGYGAEIIQPAGDRIEHIKEPLSHRLHRWSINDSSLTVMALLGLFIVFLAALGLSSQKRTGRSS